MTIFKESGYEELEVHVDGFREVLLRHLGILARIIHTVVIYALIMIMFDDVVSLEPLIQRTLQIFKGKLPLIFILSDLFMAPRRNLINISRNLILHLLLDKEVEGFLDIILSHFVPY